MEPGIRTRLTNLLAMIAAPDKYDKNVKLKFPFEFYLKKVLEYVKNMKITASDIGNALTNADVGELTDIQDLLKTYEGNVIVPIDIMLLSAIGSYADNCANTIITEQKDTAFAVINDAMYEISIKNLYENCILALNKNVTPYIAESSEPYTFIPINQCYNGVLCASFDVNIGVPQIGTIAIHFAMFIQSSSISLCAAKLGLF